MSRAVLFWLALLMFVCGGTFIWLGVRYSEAFTSGGTSKPVRTTSYKPPKASKDWLKEFELTERSGKTIKSQDLAGQLHVVSFFFASCPGTCKQQNNHIKELEGEFGEQGVKFLAITCDPANDDSATLRKYASDLQAPKDSWYFLGGDIDYTKRVAGEIYGVPLDVKTHVERLILVDRNGKIRGRYSWASGSEFNELKADLRSLLKDNDVKTSAEIREEKAKEEQQKELEAEEAEEAAAEGQPA